ncbi:MAG: hypothetical protein KKG89_17195 [Alphaproteobacteria bacterium]|nr:hypothetical protein [Alphaproteobacteria bacterium]
MDTILLVCSDEDYSVNLIGSLHDIGANVVGPISRGDVALALAAQISPNLAIFADEPAGDRDAAGLAKELHDTWGVRSLILDRAIRDVGEQPWWPESETLDRLIDGLAHAEAWRAQ